jgi:hypothetical protein
MQSSCSGKGRRIAALVENLPEAEMYRAVTLLLLTSLVVGCQSRSTPAGPSSERPVAGVIAGAAPQAITGLTVPWSCVVASLDRSVYGIFSSARVLCPSTAIHGQSFLTGAPASAPTSPLNLTSSVSGSTVNLFWSAPTGSDPASSYVVEAGSASGRVDLANFDTGSPATTLTAPGVPPGTYYVRVRSKNSAGVSGPSNETVVNVGGGGGSCGAAPNPPTNLSTSSSGSTVTLEWAAPAGGCAPTAYVIEAGSSPGLSNLANFSTGNTSTVFTAGGVGNGRYYVRVRSTTAAGTSAPSNEATLIVGPTTDTVCVGAPTGLSGSFTGNTISVTWLLGAGAPSSYIVEAGRASGLSDVVVADTGNLLRIFSITLPTGTYYFRVKAKGSCGTSGASNEVAVTITTAGSQPPMANFIVIAGPGVGPGQCGLVKTGTGYLAGKCTFDASSSTPNPGITEYRWLIGSEDFGMRGVLQKDFLVGCGFDAVTKPVTLTVTSPGGTNSVIKQVTFIKQEAC